MSERSHLHWVSQPQPIEVHSAWGVSWLGCPEESGPLKQYVTEVAKSDSWSLRGLPIYQVCSLVFFVNTNFFYNDKLIF